MTVHASEAPACGSCPPRGRSKLQRCAFRYGLWYFDLTQAHSSAAFNVLYSYLIQITLFYANLNAWVHEQDTLVLRLRVGDGVVCAPRLGWISPVRTPVETLICDISDLDVMCYRTDTCPFVPLFWPVVLNAQLIGVAGKTECWACSLNT